LLIKKKVNISFLAPKTRTQKKIKEILYKVHQTIHFVDFTHFVVDPTAYILQNARLLPIDHKKNQ
jgi:hypothetical protein